MVFLSCYGEQAGYGSLGNQVDETSHAILCLVFLEDKNGGGDDDDSLLLHHQHHHHHLENFRYS